MTSDLQLGHSQFNLIFSRPYLVRSRYWYAVASVCRLSSVVVVCNVMYCG